MRVVVTGASGFLGSEVVRQAHLDGLDVRATGRRDDTAIDGYRAADILDASAMRSMIHGADAVVHVAGLAHVFGGRRATPEKFAAVNVRGTENVVRAAVEAGVSHVVHVSSVAVYGPNAARASNEDTDCRPEGPYAESKWLGERRARSVVADSATRLTILRMATVYGEGDPGNVRRLIRAVDRGRFVWIGDGSNLKSLLHREDAARACLVALRRTAPGTATFNISAEACTMSVVVDAIAGSLGRIVPRWRIPGGFAQTMAEQARKALRGRYGTAAVSATVRKWLADDAYDATRFREAVGFDPVVGLVDGLRREVAWYRTSGARP